jgi:hypothetical protein
MMTKYTISSNEAAFQPLRVGTYYGWEAEMINLLNSEGSHHMLWMQEGETCYRERLLIQMAEADPNKKFKYESMLNAEYKAMAIVRSHVERFLNDATTSAETLPELFRQLKLRTVVVSRSAVNHYTNKFNSIRCASLNEVEGHIKRFEELVQNLADNSSAPTEATKINAFMKSWPKILDGRRENLEDIHELTYIQARQRLRDYSVNFDLIEKEQTQLTASMAEEQRADNGHQVFVTENLEQDRSLRSTRKRTTGMIPTVLLRRYAGRSAADLTESEKDVWRNHTNPTHNCTQRDRCWFIHPEGRPQIVEEFLQQERTRGLRPKVSLDSKNPRLGERT